MTELSGTPRRVSSHVPAALSDLKVTVAATSHGNPAGEIYGKVVDITPAASGLARVRFTSVTPQLRAWMTPWRSA